MSDELSFNNYQKLMTQTAIYPDTNVVHPHKGIVGANYIYPALGLVDEAGEVAGKVKKILRDKIGQIRNDDGVIDPEITDMITKELGDVLWYVSQLAREFEIKLQDVANANVEKILSRQERGVIQGSGDNR